MADRHVILALITDLGVRDPALAQFKAGVLALAHNFEFVDITHDIKPRDLLEAAFTLDRVYRDFPIRRTAFIVLVESLLGAPRRPLLATSMDYYYFAPDNGVLSFAYEHDDVSNVYHITAEHMITSPCGSLSAHRDVYASAVGWWVKGLDPTNFGDTVNDHVRVTLPKAQRTSPKEVKGIVLAVQRHGGLVTNISENDINAVRAELGPQVPFRAVLGDNSIPLLSGWAEGAPECVALYGPSGYVEIISAKGDASKTLSAKRGDAVAITFG